MCGKDSEEPVRIPVTDVFDLHTVPPRDVRAVVEAYLEEAHRLGLTALRIIHGRGIGVQREVVRAVLARTEFWLAHRLRPRKVEESLVITEGHGRRRSAGLRRGLTGQFRIAAVRALQGLDGRYRLLAHRLVRAERDVLCGEHGRVHRVILVVVAVHAVAPDGMHVG